MNKLLTFGFAISLFAAGSVQAASLQYSLGTVQNNGYILNYTTGTGSFFVGGGFVADPSTATPTPGGPAGNPFAMTPTGSSLYFSDGGGMGGSYFSGRNIELFTTSATNAGLVYTSSTDPFVATVEPVWTFTESFSDSSSAGSHFYTLQLTGTAAELFQSTSSTSLGTLIASGPETGAFPTNLPANPVPEPTTFGLLLSAGLSVIAVRKYRIRIR